MLGDAAASDLGMQAGCNLQLGVQMMRSKGDQKHARVCGDVDRYNYCELTTKL